MVFCSVSFAADPDIYVFTDYTPVRLLYLIDGANLEIESGKAGLVGARQKISISDIPVYKTDRAFWKFQGGKVIVDNTKKKESDDAKTKKSSDKTSAITKLKATGLTDEELLALGIKGGD